MAYSKQDLVTKLNAEVVGGNYIAGGLGNRVFVGKINEEGVFYITEEGEAMLAALEGAVEDKVNEEIAQVVADAKAEETASKGKK